MVSRSPDQPFARRCQAVVLIHGIGEQRPMDSLRSFVDCVLNHSKDAEEQAPAYYSRPDTFSNNFELRTLRTTQSRPRTEFIELYWAHRMPDASWPRLLEWGRELIMRPKNDVPQQFRSIWRLLRLTVIAVAVLMLISIVIWLFPSLNPSATLKPTVSLPIGAAALLVLVNATVLAYVGDAAIYLSPHPKNIEARNAIRTAGVNLIQRLHESGRYDRIVVVGHSLGSVIGYDILTYAWKRFHLRHGKPERPHQESLKQAQRFAAVRADQSHENCTDYSKAWSELTTRLWLEQRGLGFKWLVTDFITLGSPLAHGDLLLARDRSDFQRKVSQLELPVCPPAGDNKGRIAFPIHYRLQDNDRSRRTISVLHHAAWPAVVRWKNLYFPSWRLFFGDAIGGPLAPLFGPGIEDIPVCTSIWNGWLAHTNYWKRAPNTGEQAGECVEQLRNALDLQRQTFPIE
jgi:hypothetical protein